MAREKPLAEAAASTAAEWIVRLSSDDEQERSEARTGFDAWKRADPGHAAAAKRIEAFVARARGVADGTPRGAAAARVALEAGQAPTQGQRRRRGAVAALAIAFLLGSVPVALRVYPPARLTADVRTCTGCWSVRTLSDGSTLTLDSGSAVNLRFGPAAREVQLVHGRMLVDVAHDAARPFVVSTPQGQVQALGTRFVVDRLDGATVVTMIESRVSVRPLDVRVDDPEAVRVIRGGQRVRFTADAVGPVESVDAASVSEAWRRHQLVVQEAPLPEVLDELERFRPGRIRYDGSALANIRVSAVLPLDDTDRALQLLADSFPQLRIRKFTPYLVHVDSAPRD